MKNRPFVAGETGMTLVELLVVVTILVIIALPIASVITTALIIPSQEQQRVTDTGDAQLLQSFMTTDVQSAASTDTTGASECGVSAGVVLGLKWTDQTGISTTTSKTVAYVHTPGSTTLVRYYCDSGGTSNQLTVLKAVQSASVACTTATCLATITEVAIPQQGAAASPYTFTVSSTRRDS